MSVTLSSYKRFAENAKIDVDGPLIAIVGPNEAGKTSILQALQRLNDSDPISRSERTRSASVTDEQTVIEAVYLIEPDDRNGLAELPGADEPDYTRWFRVRKLANGAIRGEVLPGLKRDLGPRRTAAEQLSRVRRARLWPVDEPEEGEALHAGVLDALEQVLLADDPDLPEDSFHDLSAVSDAVRELDENDTEQLEALASALDDLRRHESTPHPNERAAQLLERSRPDFLLFDEEQRELLTEYDLAEVADDPPPALANLARLGDLDLTGLRQSMAEAEAESGTVKAMIERANERLKTKFEAWSQAQVAASFDPADGTTIRVHVSNPAGGYSRLEERSDGLKAFIALLALTARDDRVITPIVMIDEAERHLHYDGQADLIQVLSRQEAIKQIVYTTHSAGCLPEDLGAGVRVVVPDEGSNHSHVENRFWTEGEGFGPLLGSIDARLRPGSQRRHERRAE